MTTDAHYPSGILGGAHPGLAADCPNLLCVQQREAAAVADDAAEARRIQWETFRSLATDLREQAATAQARIDAALALHDEHFCRECREPNCETRQALTGSTSAAPGGVR